MIVSHDRAFLERTVTRVLELDEIAHTAAEYGGGWAGYLELRATAARHAEERYETYATQRDRLTDRARRQRQWSETGVRKAKDSATSPTRTSAPSAPSAPRSRRRRSARPRRRSSGSTRSTSRGGAGSCSCASAAASAPATSPRGWSGAVLRRGTFVLGPLDLELAWGERVALVGPERQRQDDARRRRSSAGCRSPRARAGSARACASATLDQARRGFDGAAALLDAFVAQQRAAAAGGALAAGQVRPRERRGRAPGADSLSPGERTRASLALLMASGANWLVLDEPTNHLDLPAIEQLETALGAFDGTLLLVTHDRQLLDAVALDRTIALGAGRPHRAR